MHDYILEGIEINWADGRTKILTRGPKEQIAIVASQFFDLSVSRKEEWECFIQ